MPPLSAEPSPQDDWDPRSPAVLQDQLAAYDEMRGRCPVAHSEYLGWSLFRHADVLQVVEDHETFSNVVSTHLNVPDGMDPPEHTVYREMVDRYFTTELVDAFEVECRRVVVELLGDLPRDGSPWDVAELSDQVALRTQSAYLGWPERLHEPLRAWTARNRAAVKAEADLLSAQQELRMATVTAPFAGEVVQVDVQEGDSVASGTDVFVLVARGTLEAERERIVVEANALAAGALGESLGGSSVTVVRRRLEEAV